MIIPGIIAASGGGPTPYHADAVHFDGKTVLTRITAMSGVADGPTFTFAGWIKTTQAGAYSNLWGQSNTLNSFNLPGGNSASEAYMNDESPTQIGYYTQNTSGAKDFAILSNGPAMNDGTWHQFIVTGDTNHPLGFKTKQVVQDGVLVASSVDFEDGDAFDISWSAIGMTIGGFNFADFDAIIHNAFVGDAADWYFNFTEALDLGVQANIDKFILAGKPVDPSGFPAGGALLFSGDATGFAVNQGSGGSFAVVSVRAGTGNAGPGPCTLTGAVIGQAVTQVFDSTSSMDVSADFETTISVTNQIQQTGAADYSADDISVILTGTLTNSSTSPSD